MSVHNNPLYAPTSPWRHLSPGGVILEAGSAAEFRTGDWRSERPVWNEKQCKHCFLCWTVCPDVSIIIRDDVMTGIDYDHCKGCGLCVHTCKFDALSMIAEGGER